LSEILELEARLLAIAQGAVGGLSVTDEVKPIADYPSTSLPLAYADGFAKRAVPAALGAEDRVLEGLVVLVTDVSLEKARELGEKIEAAIVADRTLAGLVSTTNVEIESGSAGGASGQPVRHFAALAVRAVKRDGSSAAAGGPLVRWELRARARLRGALTGGTTAAAYRTKIAADVAAALSGVRMASDLEKDPIEAVPASSTRFQLSMLAGEVLLSSNTNGVHMFIALRVYHRGAAGETERAYTEGAMAVATAALLARDFWKAGFTDVDVDAEELPEISFPGDVARV